MANSVSDKFKLYYNETKSNKVYILLYLVLIMIFTISMLDVAHLLHIKFICLLIIILLIFGVFLINYHTLHDTELYKTVFFIVLIVGVLCALTTPIFNGLDEEEHYERAFLTSQADFFPDYNGSFYSQVFVSDLLSNRPGTFLDTDIANQPLNHSDTRTSSAFQQNPFFGYLGAGLGILLAKLFSFNLLGALWLPRIINILIYATCAAFAVKKAPFGKVIFIAMACMPQALYQSSIVSIDHLINGLALIIVAYILYMYKYSDKITKKDILIYSLLCIGIGLCKVTCFVFILALLFLPIKKIKNKKIIVYSIIAVVISVVIALLWAKFYASPYTLNSYRFCYLIENNVNQTAQINFMLTNKKHAIWIISNNVFGDFIKNIYYINGFSYPHENVFQITPLIAYLYLPFLGFLYIFYPLKEKLSINLRLNNFILSTIFIIGTVLVLYLTWTPVGSDFVLGIQTRYFLPIYFLFPYILNISSKFNFDKTLVDKTVIAVTLVFAFSVVLSNLFFYY